MTENPNTEVWLDISGNAASHGICWAAVIVRNFPDVRGKVNVLTGPLTMVDGENPELTAARMAVTRWHERKTVFFSDHDYAVQTMCLAGHEFRLADKASVFHLLAHTAAGGERYKRLYEMHKLKSVFMS